MRSYDLHAVRRLDAIYLNNGPEDFYYKRLREKAVFVLMGCSETCDTGFCVSMGTNQTEEYSTSMKEKFLYKSGGDRYNKDNLMFKEFLERGDGAIYAFSGWRSAAKENFYAVIPIYSGLYHISWQGRRDFEST